MENGLISKSPYRFMPVCTRAVLVRPDIQRLLREHHRRPRSLFCGCGAELGLELPVVVKVENGLYYVAREDIEKHPIGCFLRRPGDAFAREPVRTSRIFEAPSIVLPQSRLINPGEWDGAMAAFEDYTAYARRVLSWGVAEAIIALNSPRLASAQPFAQPETRDVFRGIDAMIRMLAFRDAPNGYVAAQHTGARLRVGLIFSQLATEEFPLPVSVSWWNNGSFDHGLVMVPRCALVPALADLQVFGNVQAAPYLVVAAVESNGFVRRMFLHQVYLSAQKLVLVESAYEARFAASLIRNGRAFVKPIREDEIDRVLAALGFEGGAEMQWSYRPDFIILPGTAGRSLEIVEVRGFKPGKNVAYDERLAAKATHYEKLGFSRGWGYRCVDGWTQSKDRPCDYREIFASGFNGFEAPPATIMSRSIALGFAEITA